MLERFGAHGAIGCLLVLIGNAPSEARQSADPMARPILHWGASGTHAHQIDLSGLPIVHDTVFYYEHEFGTYPRFWNGVEQNGGTPHRVNLQAHLAKVRADVPKKIPHPAWDGFACIDFESWHPVWDLAPRVFRDAAVQQVLLSDPKLSEPIAIGIAKARHEIAAREFMLQTIEVCKSMRPRTRWGYFNLPSDGHAAYVSRTPWLWEASTAFFPAVSVDKMCIESGVPGPGQTSLAAYRAHVDRAVGLARSVSPGKPVIAVGWLRYPEFNSVYAFQFLTHLDLGELLRRPREQGADGMILWDYIANPGLVVPYSLYVQTSVRPAVDHLVSQDPAWRFLPGDSNDDGRVEYRDVISVLSSWGFDYRPGSGSGDANRDGLVDFGDIFSVMMGMGTSSAYPVP